MKDGRQKIEELAERRKALTQTRIKQAEIAAIERVKTQTSEIVIAATKDIIKTSLKDNRMRRNIENSINDLKNQLK